METHICVCEEYKTIMSACIANRVKITDLYEKLYYVLRVENNISEEEIQEYKIKLVDIDTTMANLKNGCWL